MMQLRLSDTKEFILTVYNFLAVIEEQESGTNRKVYCCTQK